MSTGLTQPILIESDYYKPNAGGGETFKSRADAFANSNQDSLFDLDYQKASDFTPSSKMGGAVNEFLKSAEQDLYALSDKMWDWAAFLIGIFILIVLFKVFTKLW